MKKSDYKKQGKKNRASGKRFEIKVREDLEKNGWIVFRNSNDVEFGFETKIVHGFVHTCFRQAKSKWNPFLNRAMMTQSGFPDFICIKIHDLSNPQTYYVQFVECKGGDEKHRNLDKEEKEKVKWIKENLKILVIIANKGKKRGEIKYVKMLNDLREVEVAT